MDLRRDGYAGAPGGHLADDVGVVLDRDGHAGQRRRLGQALRVEPIGLGEPPLGQDRASSTLDVDVVTGHDGLAADWAATVEVGDDVGVAGPKTFPELPSAERYVLLGDESAIPAIEAMLERHPWGSSSVTAAIEARPHHHRRDGRLEWLVPRAGSLGRTIVDRLDVLVPGATDVVVWVAGESSFARTVRASLRARPRQPRHVRAAGYWRRLRTSTISSSRARSN